MYFSRKKKILMAQMIKGSADLLCRISLDAGWCGPQEVLEMSDMMFRAWRAWSSGRWTSFSRNYSGILRKFYVAYDSASGMCRPRFCLLALIKGGSKNEEWRIRKKIYSSWCSAWCGAVRNFSDVSVSVEFLDKEESMEAVERLCSLSLFESHSSDDEIAGIKNQVGQRHRTFSSCGVFRKALNRHVSVGEKK